MGTVRATALPPCHDLRLGNDEPRLLGELREHAREAVFFDDYGRTSRVERVADGLHLRYFQPLFCDVVGLTWCAETH